MDIKTYLNRINYRGSATPDTETLKQLHVAHLMAVPFENLSIHAGEPITLDDDALFDKIVRRGRGGFCYELNGLFAALLRALGFEVTKLAAAVVQKEGGYSADFDHMALAVTPPGQERWLIDVGFGDLCLEPLRLDHREKQVQGKRAFRIDFDGHYHILNQRDGDGTWAKQYRFTLHGYQFADYTARCHYHQTSPESHFTQRRICSRATPTGRITLSDRKLIFTENSERHEQELADEAAFTEALQKHFGINAPEVSS